MPDINKQEIITGYKKNKSISAIAIEQNCSRAYVYEVLEKARVLGTRKALKKTRKQKIYEAIIRACNETQIDPAIAEPLARLATAKILTLAA